MNNSSFVDGLWEQGESGAVEPQNRGKRVSQRGSIEMLRLERLAPPFGLDRSARWGQIRLFVLLKSFCFLVPSKNLRSGCTSAADACSPAASASCRGQQGPKGPPGGTYSRAEWPRWLGCAAASAGEEVCGSRVSRFTFDGVQVRLIGCFLTSNIPNMRILYRLTEDLKLGQLNLLTKTTKNNDAFNNSADYEEIN